MVIFLFSFLLWEFEERKFVRNRDDRPVLTRVAGLGRLCGVSRMSYSHANEHELYQLTEPFLLGWVCLVWSVMPSELFRIKMCCCKV